MNFIAKTCLIALSPLSIFTVALFSNKHEANLNISIQRMDSITYGPGHLFDPQTKPVLISKQFAFTEGPAANTNGDVFFTDQPNNAIWKYDTDGKLTLFGNHATGRSNGMYFDKQGNLITCADEQNQIWSISADGTKHKVLLNDHNGRKFNGPNDLWIDGKGGIYFTDPYYQRDYWTRKHPEIEGEKVYYLPPGQTQAIVVSDILKKPNGIAGTRDGKYLYIADIGDDKTYRFTIGANGALTHQHLFTTQGSDGMTLDNEGNVYLTGKGVTIYSPKGEKIGWIDISEPWTANLCFGGKDRKVLFITASKAVYTFQMKIKGANKNASGQR